MPSQFVNWGRFTQLDGQMLLPIVLVLYLALIETRTSRYRLLLLTMLSFAGLFFVHYRIFIFAIFLAAILWGWAMWRPAFGQSRWRLLRESSLLAGGWVILLLPWLWRLAMGFGGTTAVVYASGFDKSLYGNYFGFATHELLDFGMYGYLWALAGLGAIWGLWKRNAMAIAVLLWAISIFAAANLNLINFTPLYSNLIVIIAIYLPLAVLCGYLIGEMVKWIGSRVDFTNRIKNGRYPFVTAGLLVALLGIGVGSVQRDLRLVAPENIFLRTEDVAAIDWIQQEIPQDALFYVATSFWMPIVAHGLDAGYFLPLVAGRQTIIPLQNYSSDGTLEYRNFINQRLLDLGAATDAQTLWQTMRAYDITHIYIGKRPTDLSPQLFWDDPAHFELLYDKDGVWIFAVRTTEEL